MFAEARVSNPDVIVVGAGLAGLACSQTLVAARLKVLLLQQRDAPGRRVRTDAYEGFLLYRGFQVFLIVYPEGRRYLDLKTLALRRFIPGAKVWRGGRLHTVADPLRRPGEALSHLFGGPGTFGDKLCVLELRQSAVSGELQDLWHRSERTSLRHLQELGFTDGMLNGFLRPFFAGIFMERELATSSRFLEFVFRMFATGDTAVPEQGMGAIPQQLAATLPTCLLRMHAPVVEVWGYRVRLEGGETIGAKAVVVATDPKGAEELLPGLAAHRMNRVTCLYFAAPEPPVEGPWLLLNGENHGLVNNVAVMSEVSPAYAPKGQALISVSVQGTPLEGEALQARVREELTGWFGNIVSKWRHLRT